MKSTIETLNKCNSTLSDYVAVRLNNFFVGSFIISVEYTE